MIFEDRYKFLRNKYKSIIHYSRITRDNRYCSWIDSTKNRIRSRDDNAKLKYKVSLKSLNSLNRLNVMVWYVSRVDRKILFLKFQKYNQGVWKRVFRERKIVEKFVYSSPCRYEGKKMYSRSERLGVTRASKTGWTLIATTKEVQLLVYIVRMYGWSPPSWHSPSFYIHARSKVTSSR